MSMLTSWFSGASPLQEKKKQPPEGSTSAAVVTLPHVNNSRQASIRRSSLSNGLLSPSQILAKLRSSSEFHVGRFSASYVLDGVVLGQGTFGCVRRCFSSQGGRGKRFFAAKEIRYAELKESEVEDILSEVDVMRSLNHQHICHLKEAWLDGAKAILVQELLEVYELSRLAFSFLSLFLVAAFEVPPLDSPSFPVFATVCGSPLILTTAPLPSSLLPMLLLYSFRLLAITTTGHRRLCGSLREGHGGGRSGQGHHVAARLRGGLLPLQANCAVSFFDVSPHLYVSFSRVLITLLLL